MATLAGFTASEVRCVMEDLRTQLVKLREQAEEFDRIASRATDAAKKELFTRLAEHFIVLASEVEKTMARMGARE